MTAMSEWTTASYAAHNEALRVAEQRLNDERDRRYGEVLASREKARQIKDEGDRTALLLAREIQTYKDEQANQLREQINNERGLYVTRGELRSEIDKILVALHPLSDYITAQQGVTQGKLDLRLLSVAIVGVAGTLMGIIVAVIGLASRFF